MKYDIDFAYVEPAWGTISLIADNEDEARTQAFVEIERSYPEAEEIEVTIIREAE